MSQSVSQTCRCCVTASRSDFPAQVFAQAATPDQRTAPARQDYEKYCTGTAPGGGRIVACLNKHRNQVDACLQKAIDARKK